MTRRWLVRVAIYVSCLLLVQIPPEAAGLELEFGVQAGLSLAQSPYELGEWLDQTECEHGYDPGMLAGMTITVSFPPYDVVSLESGVFWQAKGGKTRMSGWATTPDNPDSLWWSTSEWTWNLDYITVPVLARVSFGHGSLKPYVKAGPELGFLLSAKREYESMDTPGPKSEVDFKDALASTDLGILVAAGVEFAVGDWAVFAEASYCYGLADVAKDPDDGDFENKLHNRVIGITAGIRF